MKESKTLIENNKKDLKVMPQTPPTISVIIPCYNDGKYIQDAVDSVLTQTIEDYEVIIINDGSSDLYTNRYLQSIKHKKIQLISLNRNEGLSNARNIGIERAKGKYILPLDADDKIAPSYLEKAKKILDSKKEIGIVYCNAELFGTTQGKWLLPQYSFPEILAENMIFATAMFRKNDWITVNGYNKNMCYGHEDYDFWLSLIELGKEVYKIEETLFYYRQKESSMLMDLTNDRDKEIESYVQVFNNHKKLYTDNIDVLFRDRRDHIQKIQERDQQIHERNLQIQERDQQIQERDQQIQERDQQIQYWHDVAQSLRIKNRIKKNIKKLIPHKIWKILRYLKHNPNAGLHVLKTQGIKALLNAVNKVETLSEDRIGNKYTYIEPTYSNEVKTTIKKFKNKPLISIIMPVYNVDPKWLNLAIKSIESQWYENWELCIADDKSTNQKTLDYLKAIKNPKIKVKLLTKNLNISGASNEALKLTSGEYIALMDNDDEITPDALYEVVKIINETGAEFIYSDEDKLEMDGSFSDPHFKPDFAPDMFLSQNYLSHLGVIKKELIDNVDGFTVGLEGAQDYDLYLKVLEHTDKIYHIQKVLYHWRKIPGSTAAEFSDKSYAQDAGLQSLQHAMHRRKIAAQVENGKYPGTYRIKYDIIDNPLVSIVIPFKDKPELLTMCIKSILDKTTYKNFEIIGISNNSEEKNTFDEMERLESLDDRIKFYEYNVPFNYSDINNHAVETYTKGEQILLLNNDIEIITPEWIESMLEFSQRDDVGVVGAKLYYPNETIQHAGISIGVLTLAGHNFKHHPRSAPAYMGRESVIQNVSAVTAACCIVKKSIFEEVNGLNDQELKIAFNDVDFCLRVKEKGYLNIFTPYCEAYHHESISRGVEDTIEKKGRFKSEVEFMQNRHKTILKNGDPYYNSNLTLDREDFSFKSTL